MGIYPELETPLPPPQGENRPRQPFWNAPRVKWTVSGICLIAIVVCLLICFHRVRQGVQESYEDAKNAEASAVYDDFYQTAYDYAEKKNHVSNRATIAIQDLTRLSRLEVLKVSDCEFVIENAEDNENRITSWIEVQGIGVFTVDLQAAEFVIDEQRQHVLVRAWKPELTNCTVEKAVRHFWSNDIWNDSIKVGVQLTREQMSEGRRMVEDSIRQNRSFYDSALSAAESAIVSLVKSWNPEYPDLTVEVEFLDTP